MGYTPPWLSVVKATGYTNISPIQGTTDDLTIYPNSVDTTTSIKIFGTGGTVITVATGNAIDFYHGTVNTLGVIYTTPDVILYGRTADKNIFLQPTGTGTVKFGTYTAGAATDSTGYITITDAGGTARKLMVQA